MTIDLTPRAGLTALLTGYDEATAAGSSWRERLIVEASELTRTGGWGSITMAKLADRVGVSRQTVYNEIGSKTQLAQALVMHELEMFLRVVDAAFQENPDDLVAAIRVAVRRVLEMGRTNPLLHAVLLGQPRRPERPASPVDHRLRPTAGRGPRDGSGTPGRV